jgi:4-oxalocrotonate tautomerase
MPYLNLRTIKGMLTDEQKRHLMEKFTELLIETEGGGDPAFRKTVWIHIEEEEPSNWQLGEMRPTAAQIAGFVAARGFASGGIAPVATACGMRTTT